MKSLDTIQLVSSLSQENAGKKKRLEISAAAWVEQHMIDSTNELESAVVSALEDGWGVTDVARAYTLSGKTPNRNAIHEIKNRNASIMETWAEEYPFEWVGRDVTTARGKRTVYDVVLNAKNFGPEKLTDTYTWRFDRTEGTTEPVVTESDPYPSSKFYRQALTRWLTTHPYPGED